MTSSKMKLPLTTILLSIAILAASSYLLATSSSGQAQSPSQTGTGCTQAPSSGDIIADWTTYYQSIPAMKSAADAVVVGDIMSSHSVLDRSCGLLYTDYVMSVKIVLKGTVNTELTVRQVGGVLGDVRQEVVDDPLMTVGDQVVLFLRLDPTLGHYGVLSGPAGRFVVKNQLVYSLNVLSPTKPIKLAWTVDGTPLAQFVAQIQ